MEPLSAMLQWLDPDLTCAERVYRGASRAAGGRHGRAVNKAGCGENIKHPPHIKITGAAQQSHRLGLNPGRWWIYQPLAQVPEAPRLRGRTILKLGVRPSARFPNLSLLVLTALITTSTLQKELSVAPAYSGGPRRLVVESGMFLLTWSR